MGYATVMKKEIGVAIEQHRMEDLFETGKSQTH